MPTTSPASLRPQRSNQQKHQPDRTSVQQNDPTKSAVHEHYIDRPYNSACPQHLAGQRPLGCRPLNVGEQAALDKPRQSHKISFGPSMPLFSIALVVELPRQRENVCYSSFLPGICTNICVYTVVRPLAPRPTAHREKGRSSHHSPSAALGNTTSRQEAAAL